MKSIVIIECKKCGQQYAGESIPLILKGLELSIVLKTISRCSACKEKIDRSPGKRYI